MTQQSDHFDQRLDRLERLIEVSVTAAQSDDKNSFSSKVRDSAIGLLVMGMAWTAINLPVMMNRLENVETSLVEVGQNTKDRFTSGNFERQIFPRDEKITNNRVDIEKIEAKINLMDDNFNKLDGRMEEVIRRLPVQTD